MVAQGRDAALRRSRPRAADGTALRAWGLCAATARRGHRSAMSLPWALLDPLLDAALQQRGGCAGPAFGLAASSVEIPDADGNGERREEQFAQRLDAVLGRG